MTEFLKVTGVLMLSIAASAGAVEGTPIDDQWAAGWRADLEFARVEMPRLHLRIDHTTPLAQLEAAIDELAARVPGMTHHQAVVELARVVAMIGDGHSRLTLPMDPASGFAGGHRPTEAARLPGAPFGHYPVRFYLYPDALAIERIGADYPEFLGARVLRIGTMSAAEARAAMEPIIQRDNPQQVLEVLPHFLVIPELLHARGVSDSLTSLALELETPSGEPRRLTLEPAPPGAEIDWAEPTPDTVPPFRRRLDQNYRFEYLAPHRTVYFRYVTVRNDDGESLADFARRMFAFIDAEPVSRLVIDIRSNGGGNNWLNAPLEIGVIRAEKLWRPGGLVVLTDRHTFSAAMNFVSFLADRTPAVFVGEAPGGRPNHYGDSRKLVLPETGLTIRLSTVYHQDSSAEDDRAQIDPHVPVALTAADARNARDPVLAAVLRWDDGSDAVAGVWVGVATIRHYVADISLSLRSETGAWSGSFGIPGWIDDTAIAKAKMQGGEIRFQVPALGTSLSFRARVGGKKLIGMFDYQGQWYPFVAQRHVEDAAR